MTTSAFIYYKKIRDDVVIVPYECSKNVSRETFFIIELINFTEKLTNAF